MILLAVKFNVCYAEKRRMFYVFLQKKEPIICPVCGMNCYDRMCYGPKKIKDATVCRRCIIISDHSVSEASELTLEDIRPRAEMVLKRQKNREEMPVDIKMGDYDSLCIDTTNRRWYCLCLYIAETNKLYSEPMDVYSLDDVRVTWIERYFVEDVNTKTTSDGMTKAIVGGLLGGTTGAVIGAAGANQTTTGTSVSRTHFRVHLRFLRPAELTGKEYWLHLGSERELQQFLRWFKRDGEEETASQETDAAAPDPASELRKYKAMLDEGLITQQDFDAKKKQLLGL